MMSLIEKRKDEEGFTLIELLVVIIIIGILAAIAIPVFLSQRQNANNADAESSARNAAISMETAFVENDTYAPTAPDTVQDLLDGLGYNGLALADSDANANAFCVIVGSAATGQSQAYQFVGGSPPAGTPTGLTEVAVGAACPAIA